MTTAERLTQLKQDIDDVYSVAYEKGKSEGGDTEGAYNEGYNKAYDELWDGIQLGGTRTNYGGLFNGVYWNEISFRPKYDIIAKASGSTMFDRFGGMANTTDKGIDLAKIFEDCGVELDTSKCTAINNLFYYARVSRVPTISAVGCTYVLTGVFAQCRHLETIDKFVLKDDGSNTFNNTFQQCIELKNIVIDGTIGQNGFNVQWSTKLSKDSITSIINALSSTTSGLTVTLSETAVNNMTFPFTYKDVTYNSWEELIATKSNWTISLV